MSTKTQTTSNQNTTQNQQSGGSSNFQTGNQYAPGGLQNYQQATQGWMQPAMGYAQNPFGNPFFQQQQQMGTRQAANMGQTGMNNLMANQTASGFGGSAQSPYMQEMMANQGRANSGLQAQLGFQNPMQNALGMQQSSMGMLGSYSPLQTGQGGSNNYTGFGNMQGTMNGSQTQTQGGVGSWLPQVASLGMGLASGGLGGLFGGGLSAAAGGLGNTNSSNPLGGSLGNVNQGGISPMFSLTPGGGPGGYGMGGGQGYSGMAGVGGFNNPFGPGH